MDLAKASLHLPPLMTTIQVRPLLSLFALALDLQGTLFPMVMSLMTLPSPLTPTIQAQPASFTVISISGST